jgi:2-dehydropantoate 2-reductase
MSRPSNGPKVAVVGAGAVGGYFGGMLTRAGINVVMIGRPAFVEAVNKAGLRLDAVQFQETLHPQASTELSAVDGADIVLFCVKATDTASAAKDLAKYLAPESIVVSLQNGVNNAEEIHRAAGIDALPAVVYVAAAMPEPGHIRHFGRGDLVVGPRNAKTEKVAELFAKANVSCRISENIDGELWTKLVWNCALNAISGLGRVTYGEIIASADARRVVELVVDEVLAVAHKRGIRPPGLEDPKAALAAALKVAEQMSGTRSSTAQDMARGKRTEIDSLNGYVAKLGQQLNVPTPVNLALYTLVKLQEAQFKEAGAKS